MPNRYPVALGLAAVSLLSFACHPRRAEPAAGAPARCEPDRAPGPELDPPKPVVVPTSRVGLEVALTEARLERELAVQVPEVLASGQQSVGAPGRVTYVVRRGSLDASLVGERVRVVTPVTASAQLCKPFGPICPIYARCNPRLEARVELPLVLGDDYTLGKSAVTVGVIQGCSVAGFDATPEIRRSAEASAAEARARIDSELPDVPGEVAAAWAALHAPVDVGPSGCLRLAPETVTQARPTAASGVWRSGATVTGRATLERECPPAGSAAVPPLPPLGTSDELRPGIDVAIARVVAWSEVGAGFGVALGIGEGPSPSSLEVRGATVKDQGRVVVGLVPGRASCPARVWASAEPWYDAERRELRLRAIEPLKGLARRQRPDGALLRELETTAAVPFPVDLAALERALDAKVSELVPELPPGVTAAIALETPKVEAVRVAPEGLVVILRVKGSAKIRAE